MEWILALPDGCGDEAGLAGPLRRSVGLDVGRGRARRVPSPRHVNLFTACVLYLAMVRPSRLHPACTGARSSDQGPLTAGSGAMISPSLRRPSPGSRHPAWTNSAGRSWLA